MNNNYYNCSQATLFHKMLLLVKWSLQRAANQLPGHFWDDLAMQ